MLKKLAAIGLATSIAFAPIVLAPTSAMAQAPNRGEAITAAKPAKPATVIPAATAKARECASEAGAKGLRGKPRKRFIAQCKKSGAL